MARNSGSDGKGDSKPIESSEKQDMIRRSAKARRKGAPAGKNQMGNLFGDILADKRQKALDAAEAKRQQRELQQVAFRAEQAEKAREHSWFQGLKPGSVAYKFAMAIFDAFPQVEVPTDKSKTRTLCAELDALETMSGNDILRDGAIEHGRKVATTALGWAYTQLQAKEATSAPA
jgi:hypothetical protein